MPRLTVVLQERASCDLARARKARPSLTLCRDLLVFCAFTNFQKFWSCCDLLVFLARSLLEVSLDDFKPPKAEKNSEALLQEKNF